MTVLVVPTLEPAGQQWPSLGEQVCAFIEEFLVFGPGDLRGEKAVLDDEKRALIYRMYEVFPPDHPQAGRRRFKRCALSMRKGSAKTELMAWIAACELHKDAPVRCIRWEKQHGAPVPVGGPVTDPYIPLVAYTEEQTEDLAYGALRCILEEGPLVSDFDIGLERIKRSDGTGMCRAMATAPGSREGARTTFQGFDETHLFILPRLKEAHKRMQANLAKRFVADAWSLETTTAPEPGGGSIAEETMDYARSIVGGNIKDSRLFFFHRQASDEHDLNTEEGARAALIEASGPVAVWSDTEAIIEQWRDPTTDRTYWERVWANRLVRSAQRAFDSEAWKRNVNPALIAESLKGQKVTLGFDGSRVSDSTAIVCTHIKSGYQWLAGLWERPAYLRPEQEWEVPVAEVDERMGTLFRDYEVWRIYCDPPYWETRISAWAGQFGKDRVIEWWTNRYRPMAKALQAYDGAIRNGEQSHEDSPRFAAHIGNAIRKMLPNILDERDQPLWIVQKERPDSPLKIDASVAGALSWEARNDAVADGQAVDEEESVYETRGVLVI